jgi:hypothetical protein
MNETEPKTFKITQRDCQLAQSVFAHLRRIFESTWDGHSVVPPSSIDQGDLLLASASLRALFLDGKWAILHQLIDKWDYSFDIEVIESDISLLFLSQWEPGGGHITDFIYEMYFKESVRNSFPLNEPQQISIADMGGKISKSLLQKIGVWAPRLSEMPDGAEPVGISGFGPAQFVTFERRRVPIKEWHKTRLGFLRHVPMIRDDVISYVANKLGGVHYDESRFANPNDDPKHFRVLSQAFNWEDQTILNGAVAAVGIACIELVNTPEIHDLAKSLGAFLEGRDERLHRGEKLEV